MTKTKKKKIDLTASMARTVTAEKKEVADRFAVADKAMGLKEEKKETKQEEKPQSIKPKKEEGSVKKKSTVEKPKKNIVEKVVREGVTMPSSDQDLLYDLLAKGGKLGVVQLTKTEIFRAGLHSLNTLSDSKLKEILKAVPKVKTGRRPSQ
jgi:hypothetical protein